MRQGGPVGQAPARKYGSEFRESEMIYRNLNPRGHPVSLLLSSSRAGRLSHRAKLSLFPTLYTRQNYRCVYLSFLHQRNGITGARETEEEGRT